MRSWRNVWLSAPREQTMRSGHRSALLGVTRGPRRRRQRKRQRIRRTDRGRKSRLRKRKLRGKTKLVHWRHSLNIFLEVSI